VYETIRDYNEIESRNVEFNDSNIIDISTNEQRLNTIETKFSGDSDLSNECSKKTFPSFFKTALEIRNEEKLQSSKSDRNEKIQFKKLSMEDIEIDETRNEKSIITSYNSTQKATHKDDISQMQMSGGFVCARKIHEIDMHLSSSSRSSKSKYNTSSSTPRVRRSKEDKSVKKSNKTVYEQILASARSFSKNGTANNNPDACEAKSKINDIVYSKNEDKIKNENTNNSEFAKCIKDSDMKISLEMESKVVSFIKDEKHKIQDKNKNKRRCESTEYFEHCTKSIKKKRTIHNEINDKTHNYVHERNIAENIVNDINKIETVKNSTDNITNVSIKDKGSSLKKKDGIKRSLEDNLVSEKERESVHSSHFKRHEQSKSNNRVKVPADRATQFKTAEILKSYLMKYYPSERIPDRATFSKTCREMHYNMLKKKIFGKIILEFYAFDIVI